MALFGNWLFGLFLAVIVVTSVMAYYAIAFISAFNLFKNYK
jgi:hypothetical protein